jgi:hypothetical protein
MPVLSQDRISKEYGTVVANPAATVFCSKNFLIFDDSKKNNTKLIMP